MSAIARSSFVAPSATRGAADAGAAEDEALVLAIRAGVREAEEALYRRHAARVLAIASRLLGSRADAMDVMQDTFVSALEDLHDLREPSALRGWLDRVAVRLVHRRFRRRRLLGLLGMDKNAAPVALEELADDTVSPEARAELRWLDAALSKVSAPERAAWLLRYVDGMGLEEVADACGCSLATAKRRIAAAGAVVRTHFADGDES